MKKIIIAVIIGVLVLGMVYAIKQKLKDANIVDGNNHIYKGQFLPKNYKPDNLVDLPPRDNYLTWPHQMAKIAADKITEMINDAEKNGMCLVVIGGYRDPEYQTQLLNDTPEDKRNGIAPPYGSEHQTGLAADLVGCPMKNGKRDDNAERLELKEEFDKLPEYQWLRKNASNYGFEESFRKDNENITGYPPEPWHWKFIIKKVDNS